MNSEQGLGMTPGRASTSSSVNNALRTLSLLGEREMVRVADVAEELGIANSTAHRILAMLEYHDFVEQINTGKAYQLGMTLLESGLRSIDGFDLRSTVVRHLEALRDRIGESCGFLVRDEGDVVLTEFVTAEHPLRVVENVGDRQAAYLTAGGKALLARLTEDEITALYRGSTLKALTPSSIKTHAELRHALDRIRETGVATNLEESGVGVVGIAAAVHDQRGHEVGALTITLPASRLGEDLVTTLGPSIRSAAALMSTEIY